MVNLVAPLFEAVKRSPTPVLSTTKAEKEVLPETEAEEVVPAKAEFPVALKLAEVEVVPPMRRSRVVFPG